MRAMMRRLVAWLGRLIDDALPMAPDDRADRDGTPLPDAERSRRRLMRLRLHLLEKRGKGGYR